MAAENYKVGISLIGQVPLLLLWREGGIVSWRWVNEGLLEGLDWSNIISSFTSGLATSLERFVIFGLSCSVW